MRFAIPALVVMALAAPLGAAAAPRTGYAQIASGDYRQAERTLVAERRIFPERPELMLNLAAIYQRTDRAAEARKLYDRVLAQPDTLMDIADDRTAWSHGIARSGLRRLAGLQVSSR